MPELIANRYTLLSELGRGGFATVYRALDTRLNREIALKILNPALTSDPRFIELFHREAQTAASLKHPHIVTIYDTGEFETRLFITMELLAGLDLRRRVTRDGPLPPPLTVSIIEQIASALDYAHQRGIIHRDVKAANIIVDEAGHATLTDFGLVRALESSTYGSSVSMSGGFVGSVEYIPPEMVNGEKATSLSDQYSLGVVTYEMVTGQLPFKAETPIAIAVAHSTKIPRDPSELRSDLPQGMSAAILKVLEKQPEERYANTKTFAAALHTELDRPAKEAAEQDAREAHKMQEAEAAALEAKRQQAEQTAREAEQRVQREAEERQQREAEEQTQRDTAFNRLTKTKQGEYKTSDSETAKMPWGVFLGVIIGVLIIIAILARSFSPATPAAPATIEVTRIVEQPLAATPLVVEVTRTVEQPVVLTPTPAPPTSTSHPTNTPRPADTPTSVPASASTEWSAMEKILAAKCMTCHINATISNLSLRTYADALKGGKSGPAIVPNNPGSSVLVQVQQRGDHPGQLTLEELARFIEWIDAGAPEKVSSKDGMALMYIPAGEFKMGVASSDTQASDDEKPQHTVYLDAFWIDQTEVTNAMFKKFVSSIGYQTEAEQAGFGWQWGNGTWQEMRGANWQHPLGPDSNLSWKDTHPVVQVSWNDAKAYCEWTGRRLPTEAEWEKAARGIDRRNFPWGDAAPRTTDLNFDRNIGDTTAVAKYPNGASPYGALDMAGNVWEWVADWFDERAYFSVASSNPSGPSTGTVRVLRGGSWADGVDQVRTAVRGRNPPDHRDIYAGFRCAMSAGVSHD